MQLFKAQDPRLATLLGNLRHVQGEGKPYRTDKKEVVVNMALVMTTWN